MLDTHTPDVTDNEQTSNGGSMFDFVPKRARMEPNDFCFWLQGFFEITNANKVTEEQLNIIKQHLDMVYGKYHAPALSFTYLG